MRDLPTFDKTEIIRIVRRGYGIRVQKIIPYRHIYRLETNLGTLFFKPFHSKEAKLQLIVKAQEHLKKQGFTRFIPFIPTLNGKPYYCYKKQLFYLTRWIDGHPSNYDNPFELRKAVHLFARFHKAAKGFAPPIEIPDFLGKWPLMFKKRTLELKKCRKNAQKYPRPTPFENLFFKHIDYYIEQAEKAIELLDKTDYVLLSKAGKRELPFCHHDPAHHNILITSTNKAFLIDFDYLIRDLHLHDLASLIIRNGKASTWNLKRCEFLIKAYQEIKPITPEEFAVIHAFMTYPYDIWLLARARYIEKKPWPLTYYIKELIRKTKNEKARQYFLDKFLYSYLLL
ncbi:hypothetical protein BBF96_10485 [Anoxybacter fermentans]|uniref:Aminoglycoside phosphotransferase domain-containing protein n=1 Tax=Anoxybacter fermentans TaxID=1323375 RepID=A0A3Q9HRK1_9FIRM|nr:CotS family spore coat protein [Anoxybacter fermentans]AZR73774.1 hypothetical protein BBF96_10485 [Anoxybacter fermentans]